MNNKILMYICIVNFGLHIVLNEKNVNNVYLTKLKYDELIEHIINIKHSSQKLTNGNGKNSRC